MVAPPSASREPKRETEFGRETGPETGPETERDPATAPRAPEHWATLLPRPLFQGGHVLQLLRGGDALFPAMVRAIDQAQHDIWLATYIFHDDNAAEYVAQALARAAQRGVRVRVVVDGFGSKATLAHLQQWLTPAGVALAVFRPIDRWWNWLQPGQLRRLHQKLCVVDGQIGFVGGINMIDDRVDLNHGPTEQPRLDFAVQVQGPAVARMAQAVRALWTRAWLGRDVREELAALARSTEPVARLRGLLRRLRMPGRAGLQSDEGELPPVRAAFVLRDNLRQRRTIERAYIDAIRGARERVDLVTPYFYPGQAFRRALRQAADRGVHVRLLLQGKLDYRVAGLAARVLYGELLAHGVQVFEYMPAFLHAKIGIVDGDWATVGSSNIDPLSLLLNLEANLVVHDIAFAQELRTAFETALAESQRVVEPQIPGRGLIAIAARALVAWCAYVYLRVAGATGRY